MSEPIYPFHDVSVVNTAPLGTVPRRYYEYTRLRMAAMMEISIDATEFAGIPTKGAGVETDRRFPIDPNDDFDDEC
jgi:hypothetical protein